MIDDIMSGTVERGIIFINILSRAGFDSPCHLFFVLIKVIKIDRKDEKYITREGMENGG